MAYLGHYERLGHREHREPREPHEPHEPHGHPEHLERLERLGLRGGPAREAHALYIALGDKSPAGGQAAGYLRGVTGLLGALGITIEVRRVRPKDLRDSRVLGAFRRRGIDRLPAVLARGRPLVGLAEIRAYYAGLEAEPRPRLGGGPHAFYDEPAPKAGGASFGRARPTSASGLAASRRGAPPPPPPEAPEEESPEAFLEDYFRQEMLAGGRGEDIGFGAA